MDLQIYPNQQLSAKIKKMKIIYEDKNLLVIDKPAGLVVHPGTAKIGETLVDWLLKQYPEMKKYIPLTNNERGILPERMAVDRARYFIERGNRMAREPRVKEASEQVIKDDVEQKYWPDPTRPGIVHRLDKDTSGLILIAKNPNTQKFLQQQFKNRKVEKTYLALVLGKVEPKKGEIKISIQRHPQKGRKMAVSYLGEGKSAKTYYNVLRFLTYYLEPRTYYLSLLEVKPKTGRMHQIRVHLKHQGWPIIGDQTYNTKESKRVSKKLALARQFLHAYKLKIKLANNKSKQFQSDLPKDLQALLKRLK